jgi:HEAT repeat protein
MPLFLLLPFLVPSFAQPAPDEIGKLLERMKTEDPVERRRLGGELFRIGPTAVDAMVRTLESGTPIPMDRVAALLRQLSSTSWKDRSGATQELAQLGRGIRTILEEAAGPADPEVAWRIRAALAEIQEKAGRDEVFEDLRAVALCGILATAGDARATAPLLRLLASGPSDQRTELRLRAADGLGQLRASMNEAQVEEAAERITAILERTAEPLAKGLLLKALGRLGTPSALHPLAALLADRSEKNLHIKRSCMAALIASDHPRAVRAVVDALDAEEVYVRQGAADLLAERAGLDFGFDPRATPEENRKATGQFRAWGAATFGKAWEK